MEIQSRKKLAKILNDKRKEKMQIKINSMFDIHTKRIRDIQNSLAKRQNSMALKALTKYSAYKIQSVWRAFVSRRELRNLILARFIYDWFFFRRYMGRRYRAAAKLNRYFKYYIQKKITIAMMRMLKAARIIKKNIQILVAMKKYNKRIFFRRIAQEILDHFLLFGFTRASRFITRANRQNFFLLKLILSVYGRQKRIKFLKGIDGKVVYHYLACNVHQKLGMSSNPISDLIKRLVNESQKTPKEVKEPSIDKPKNFKSKLSIGKKIILEMKPKRPLDIKPSKQNNLRLEQPKKAITPTPPAKPKPL